MLTINPNNINNLKIVRQHNKHIQSFKGSKPENKEVNKNKNVAIGIVIGAMGIGISTFAAIKNKELLKQKFFDIASSKKAAPFFDRIAALIDNHWARPTNKPEFTRKLGENYCRGIRPVSSRFYRFLKLNDKFSKAEDIKRFKTLQDNGVKTIIDFTRASKTIINKEKQLASEYGINYVNIPLTGLRPPEPNQIKQFFRAVKQADGHVYSHCIDGRDRTGIMSAFYDMFKKDLTPQQAFDVMKSYNHNPKKFPKLKEFLFKVAESPEYATLRKELTQIIK